MTNHERACLHADSTINGFQSGVAPVAILERNSSLVFDGCTVSDNVNTENLAAVYASALKADTPSAVVLRRSSLSGNPAPFFGAWLPQSASFYSDDEGAGVLRVGSASTAPAQPLSSLGEEQTAVVLTAAGNPLLPSVRCRQVSGHHRKVFCTTADHHIHNFVCFRM